MYLVDTYALIEWLVHNNVNYRKYFEIMDKEGGFVTELVVFELYHRVYHKADKEKADAILDLVTGNLKVIDMSLELIKEAAIFRSEMLKKKKDLSYADCLAYIAARHLKVKVLTGDKEFEGLDNVEFVK